jgi:hypothetical protein
MGDHRALAALARIERALARIEAAAARPAAPAQAAADDGALGHAHQALRGKVERAIAQIDRLIETAEAG